jgi:hypothetical protein
VSSVARKSLTASTTSQRICILGKFKIRVSHVGALVDGPTRASEILIAIQGDLVFGTIQENGASFITGNLATGEGSLSPVRPMNEYH